MRYHLRTLLIVLAVMRPLLAAVWPTVKEILWQPKPFHVPFHDPRRASRQHLTEHYRPAHHKR